MVRMMYSVVVIVLATPVSAGAARLYANVSPGGTGDCSSWANACTLPTALSNAGTGDEIWVHSGTYAPIELKNGVKIIGGFDGSEVSVSESDPAVNVTIIDGGATDQCLSSSDDAPSTVLRGFTIKSGYDSGTDGGGGIRLTNSSAVIVQCIFEDNTATYWGGAVAVDGSSTPEFINCIFRNNGNNGTVETLAGAAVYLYSGSPKFTNCLFHGNKSGAGAALANRKGSPAFINCTFSDNEANIGFGGGLHDEFGRATVRNSIFWGNTAVSAGAQIWNLPDYTTTVTYSDVEGGFTGTGNINSDPSFASPSQNDYSLQLGSPCKEKGQNSALPADLGDLDWDGNTAETLPLDLALVARKIFSKVDMGAYEYAECETDGECAGGEVCCNNVCEECCDDAGCTDPSTPRCRLSTHTCVQCLTDADCAVGCCNANQCGQCGGGGGGVK